jgi:hypothetical protein
MEILTENSTRESIAYAVAVIIRVVAIACHGPGIFQSALQPTSCTSFIAFFRDCNAWVKVTSKEESNRYKKSKAGRNGEITSED